MIGRAIGPYEILEEIGSGGMGVVYRARDTRLGRQVALKFITPSRVPDESARHRFDREARTASALNHPNICTIHEVGEYDGSPFLAMELLIGEPLKARLGRGALPLSEVLVLAIPLVDGLEAAHRQGIIHRDLKPGNVFITERGVPKLLDFGLAKVLAGSSSDADTETRPVTPDTTDPHAIVGTLAYMSPEQVRGQPLDARSDLFAFGAVLYEMVTGVTPFGGDTTGVILENVLAREPVRAGLLTPSLPAELEVILAKTLEKDRELRYQSARELLIDLKRLKGSTSAHSRSAVRTSGVSRPRPSRLRIAVALLVIAAVGAAAWAGRDRLSALWDGDRPVTLELGEITQVTSLPGLESQPTISPDGRMVAFVWQESDNKDIWVKQVSGGTPFKVNVDPADDAEPDWSPDGSTLVFRSGRRGGGIFTMPALGGYVTRIAGFGYRPRWSPDGRRVLFQARPGPLIPNEVFVVGVPDGQPAKLLAYEPGGLPYGSAEWSPDGRHIVSKSGVLVALPGLVVSSSAGQGARFLEWNGAHIPAGPFTWAAGGRAIVVETDTLGYVPVDRAQRAAGPFTRLTTASDGVGDVSRNGETLAYVGRRSAQADIWKIALDPATGLTSGSPARVIAGSSQDASPKALPDNQHLLFLSDREGTMAMYVADFDGRQVKLVDKSRSWRAIRDISPDGRLISMYRVPPVEANLLRFDPGALEVVGPPRALGAVVPHDFSPDGRYLLRATPDPTPTAVLAWEHLTRDQPTPITWPLGPAFLSRYPVRDISPMFTPDGRWVTFGMSLDLDKDVMYIVPHGGGEPRLLWEGAWRMLKSPDPRRLYMWMPRGDGNSGVIGFITFDPATGTAGSTFHRLRYEPGPGAVREGHASISSDGRWLFFAWTQEEGDVFVANLIVR